MRIVMITGQSAIEKQMCVQIGTAHELVAVIHAASRPLSLSAKARRYRKRLREWGAVHLVLCKAAKVPWLAWHAGRTGALIDRQIPAGIQQEFARLYRGRIHHVSDINGEEGLGLIGSLEPDVVVCHGGQIYKPELIRKCRLMLNYHSGLSPLYNGSSTIDFAFANGHPNLCGGTLMQMSPVIDGGNILAHYLPAIESGDNPASIFIKVIAGGGKLYSRFLDHVLTKGRYESIPQKRPLFYYRGLDWTIHHSCRVEWLIRKNLCAELRRPEEMVEYWRAPDPAQAYQQLCSSLNRAIGL